MKYCKHCGNPMGESDKKCSICGADFAGRTTKTTKSNSSGVSKILIVITVLSVVAALAVTLIFAILPALKNAPSQNDISTEEQNIPDLTVYRDAIEHYEMFLNGKLEGKDISKLLPNELSNYLCSLYNFNESEVLEAGYEKTLTLGIRGILENYKDADLSVSLEVKDAKKCGENIRNSIKERISQNFRTEFGEIKEVYLLSVKLNFNSNENALPGVYSMTSHGITEPMYCIKTGDSMYITDANGDLAFDEWDIHSYYSEYYMH